MEALPAKEMLRPDEVARYFGVTRQTIYHWINAGQLKAVKLPGKTIRIRRCAVFECQQETMG